MYGDEEEDNNDPKTCEEMIRFIQSMENSERIKFLKYLSHNHFDSSIKDDINRPTKAYIEGYLNRKLTDEEISIMKLAYEWGHFVGGEHGIKKLLKK